MYRQSREPRGELTDNALMDGQRLQAVMAASWGLAATSLMHWLFEPDSSQPCLDVRIEEQQGDTDEHASRSPGK
jgi:hypothetical protein